MAPPDNVPRDETTRLFERWIKGDGEALRLLTPRVYAELKRLALHRLSGEQQNHTLQATALVHEAYLRMVQHPPRAVSNRRHFFALASRVMRQVLVDHARERGAQKRAAGIKVELTPEMLPVRPPDVDLLALDQALTKLAALDERQSKIVEMRFFAGFSIEEAAEALDASPATVKREWVTARAWLLKEMYPLEGSSAAGASHGR